jgi:proteasome accessory factor C
MIDVFVDDGMVFVGVPRLFTRSLRLTAPEAFSLLASGRAAMELPGGDASGPLARGLAKLAAALVAAGIETSSSASDDTAGVAIDLTRPDVTDVIIDAVADGAELAMTYYTPARDAVSERTIVPRHVFLEAGNWYVRADDAMSGELRTFRIDRIETVERTGRTSVVSPDPIAEPQPFFADADVPRARLRVGPDAQWIIDRYPVDRSEPMIVEKRPSARDRARDADGWLDVTLPVASERWLARLMIRLGPNAELVEPDEFRPAVAELAQRMLDRYTA